MYYTIIPDRFEREPEGYIPCIHCNWKFDYESEVKAVAIDLMNEWNATNQECDSIHDWKVFVDEAIEKYSKEPHVKTTCKNCF